VNIGMYSVPQEGHPILEDFLHSTIPTWRECELVRW